MTDKATTTRGKILEEAIRLTEGDRNRSYGDPYENFAHTASLFNAIKSGEQSMTPHDAVLFMIAVKLARLSDNPKHYDSFVDAAAYVAIAYEVAITAGKKPTNEGSDK